jgi:hydroxypyruvate isomerase
MTWGLNCREEHGRIIPAIRATIEAAALAEIGQVIVFSGNRRGQHAATGIDNCVRGLTDLADKAATAGVALVLEVLNEFDHPDYDASTPSYVFEVVRRVDSAAVRALYDVYHASRMGASIETDISESSDLIAHIHVAGAPSRGMPGPDQEIDYEAVVRVAERAGYAGCWGHEFLPGADVVGELRAAHDLFRSYGTRS